MVEPLPEEFSAKEEAWTEAEELEEIEELNCLFGGDYLQKLDEYYFAEYGSIETDDLEEVNHFDRV